MTITEAKPKIWKGKHNDIIVLSQVEAVSSFNDLEMIIYFKSGQQSKWVWKTKETRDEHMKSIGEALEFYYYNE